MVALRNNADFQMTNPASGSASGCSSAAMCTALRQNNVLAERNTGLATCSAGRHLVALTCRQTSLTYGCRLPTYSALQPSDSAVVAILPRLGRSSPAPLSRGAT